MNYRETDDKCPGCGATADDRKHNKPTEPQGLATCPNCGTEKCRGCRGCRELTYIAKYEAMPRAEWDGKAMLYSEARNQYYSTPDDAAEDLEDDQTLADLRLVICEPNYVRQLEPDYCCDDLPEDGDVPDDVAEAMEAFNETVAGIVLSWSPGKKALALPDEGHNTISTNTTK